MKKERLKQLDYGYIPNLQVAKRRLASTSPVSSPAGFYHLEQQNLK